MTQSLQNIGRRDSASAGAIYIALAVCVIKSFSPKALTSYKTNWLLLDALTVFTLLNKCGNAVISGAIRNNFIVCHHCFGNLHGSSCLLTPEKVVVGGWETCRLGAGHVKLDGFALELSSAEIPWAYERGVALPRRLRCTWPAALLGVRCPLTASGDNRSNGFYSRQVSPPPSNPLGLGADRARAPASGFKRWSWASRGGLARKNIEADALTNHDCTTFDPAKRVGVGVGGTSSFGVLDRALWPKRSSSTSTFRT